MTDTTIEAQVRAAERAGSAGRRAAERAGSAGRRADGSLPAPGEWVVDRSHTSLRFVAKHLMVTKVRGGFTDFEASVRIGETPEESSAEAVIRTASLTTGDPKRDAHLHSPDFLDVERFPEMRFVTTGIVAEGDGEYRVEGDLTIKDITKPVALRATFEGTATDPWGGERVAFSAVGDIDREAWGMTWNQALETGGVLVSKKVKLELDVQAVRK
jgi:polyisoprenoid-binding protein YceI